MVGKSFARRAQVPRSFRRGEKQFGKIAARAVRFWMSSPCHDIGQDAKIKIGPPLNAIDGRKAGTFEGFNYSPVNKSSGITWSEENFDNDAPPKKYDYPYKGDVAIFRDLDPGWGMWGWTDVRRAKKGTCVIHVVPYGTVDHGEIMDEDALTRVLRHENAHCNGWRHSDSD
jgi:hypothetical protein